MSEEYKLVPTEVLNRIQDITDQEEERLEIARKNEDERMEAMRLNLENNVRVLWVNIIGIIAAVALMVLIIFK